MKVLRLIPLMLIAFGMYILLQIWSGYSDPSLAMSHTAFGFGLSSGATLSVTWGDLVILLGIGLLFVEIIKATAIERFTTVEHGISLGVLVLSIVAFLVFGWAGTAQWFILIVIQAIDVVAGFTITIHTASRDFRVMPTTTTGQIQD